MAKLKVGDKAKVIKDSHFHYGTVVTICEVDDGSSMQYRCKDDISVWWVYADEIEKIDDVPAKSEFKVGDLIRIRSWESMAKEFGLDGSSVIACKCSFTSSMKNLCGKTAIINSVDLDNHVSLKNWSDTNDHSWSFSTDMIEHYDEPKATEKPKLKIGDKIKVLSYDEIQKHFVDGIKDKYGVNFADGMKPYCGKVFVIKEFLSAYKFKLKDVDFWTFTDEFCIPYTDEPKATKEVKSTANKFKVGDLIKGTDKGSRYTYTNVDMTKGEVIEVLNDREIKVEILENPFFHSSVHSKYDVDSEYFDYYATQTDSSTKKQEFKIGDRVEMVENYDHIPKYAKGTVRELSATIGIEFDNLKDGHNCGGHCKDGTGYYISKKYLKHIDTEKSVSTTKSDFYNYLMTYSETNLQKFNDYLNRNATTYYKCGSSKEEISNTIDKWISDAPNSESRKAILNEMCKSVGIRDAYRTNMLAEIDKKFIPIKIKSDSTTLPQTSSIATSKTKTTKIETKKEETNMFNTTNLMENFMPSFATGDKFALTMGGKTAVKRSNGEYVIYNFETETIENQADFVLKDEDLSKMFILMPTLGSNLVAGDLILNKETFYTVTGQNKGKIMAVNMNTSANNSISKETNIIFGEKMYKKVVSLFEMGGTSSGAFGGATGAMNPMMLMLMMGKDSKGDGKSDSMMKTMMLMQMMGGTSTGATGGMNPIMMAMMMGGNDGGDDSMMKMMMMSSMMGGGANPFGAMMGGATGAVTTPKAVASVPKKKTVTKKADVPAIAKAE